jgi:hypothetical protein
MGKTAIILNARNSAGVEHADHALPDLVSEFVWLRPRASTKRFYVRDDAGAKQFLGPHVRAAWFDDHRRHCIEPVDADGQVSIRVDGRFAPDVRARLVKSGAFATNLPGYDLCANQIFNPTSMCAYSNVLTRALPPCFENSLRAIDSSKNQPNRLRFDRAREF